MREGIYFGLDAEAYHAAPGLSHSGMRDLAVSPLHYWHRRLDPARTPYEPTPAQRLGTAIHARVLEPASFGARYAKRLLKEDYPKALVTVEDLRGWLTSMGLRVTSGARKQDLIDQVNALAAAGGGEAVIWDYLVGRHARDHAGKELLDADDWAAVEAAALAVRDEPAAACLFEGGAAEVSIFVKDPETGVLCKCRLDYAAPGLTVDLKSFSNPRRKPLKEAIDDAIFHESYFYQAVWYHDLRELAWRKLLAGELGVWSHAGASAAVETPFAIEAGHRFAFVFVESSPPYGMDVVALKRDLPGEYQSEAYWCVARQHHRDMARRYAGCLDRYGWEPGDERAIPWREPVRPRELEDTDMRGLAYAAGAASTFLGRMAGVFEEEDDDGTGGVVAGNVPAEEMEASAL